MNIHGTSFTFLPPLCYYIIIYRRRIGVSFYRWTIYVTATLMNTTKAHIGGRKEFVRCTIRKWVEKVLAEAFATGVGSWPIECF